MARYIYAGYYHCDTGTNPDFNGPIHIVEATLTEHNQNTPVYLIGLSGTELILNQPTNIISDLQCGFEQNNYYLREIVKIICNEIPKGSSIILTGHSLGGMEAQQASENSILKNNYNILNVISFGSPLINPSGREGTLNRLGDVGDVVPYLSVNTFTHPVHQIYGLTREDGGYGSDFAAAHMKSYIREDVWGNYDVLGMKSGTATLSFRSNEIKGYGAYIIPWLSSLPTIDLTPWT
ncbi:MAG: hypothetical protein RSD28_07610 [Lachnospiraceae bacterium]